MLPLVPRRFAGWAAPLRASSPTVHGAGFTPARRSFPPRVIPHRVVREPAVLAGLLGLARHMDVAKLPAAFVVVACCSRGFIVFSHSGTPSWLPPLGWAGWLTELPGEQQRAIRSGRFVRIRSHDAAEIRASRRQAILWSAGRRLRSGLRGHA